MPLLVDYKASRLFGIGVALGTLLSIVVIGIQSIANSFAEPEVAYTYPAASFAVRDLPDPNRDGRINSMDLSLLTSHDGQNYTPADLNKDGTVGSADLAILLSRWTW